MDPLFPVLPEDLTGLTDEELATLLKEHEVAAELIEAEDAEFTKGLSADELLEHYEGGIEQIEAIRAEQTARVEAHQAYLERKDELAARRKGEQLSSEESETAAAESGEGKESTEADETASPAGEEPAAESPTGEEPVSETEELSVKEEKEDEPVVPAAPAAQARPLRRPPAPSPDRQVQIASGTPVIAASGHQDIRGGAVLDRVGLAKTMKTVAQRRGRPSKSLAGVEEKILVAHAQFEFPEERQLFSGDWEDNAKKIAEAVPRSVPGMYGSMALVASGGICSPLTPVYDLVNFATAARPVRDALPSFQADRGGVNLPESTVIGDITSAITVIEESEDAQGGTFATKSCQDTDCPGYNETAVTIISHCREFGNLLAMSWPEKVAHENDLTMAAHARSAEQYLLDRIKTQSVAVTNGAETLGALIYLMDAIVKATFGIRSRLRMPTEARFRALMPAVLPGLLQLDNVQTQFDRYQSQDALVAYLRTAGIEPTFYLDTPSTDTSQIADASQAAGALDGLPDNIQWALFPEGAFLHIDGGSLELGIVRDSTLNSTNDFQIFGETLENVARVAPQQACYWITTDLCASGQFPPAGTVRTCD